MLLGDELPQDIKVEVPKTTHPAQDDSKIKGS